MSEETEKKEGFFSNIKNQILTSVGVILTTLSTAFIDEIKSIAGIEGEPAPVEQVVQQPNQPVIINIPEQKPAQVINKTVVVKQAPKPKPKKKTATEKRKEEGLDW
jgi:outer membrane biosynthesis protein TonB